MITGPRSMSASARTSRRVSSTSLPVIRSSSPGVGRGLELHGHLSGHGRDAEAEGELGHGLVEKRREDAAVDDAFEALVHVPWGEARADRSCFLVDLEMDAKALRVLCAADIAALVVA